MGNVYEPIFDNRFHFDFFVSQSSLTCPSSLHLSTHNYSFCFLLFTFFFSIRHFYRNCVSLVSRSRSFASLIYSLFPLLLLSIIRYLLFLLTLYTNCLTYSRTFLNNVLSTFFIFILFVVFRCVWRVTPDLTWFMSSG